MNKIINFVTKKEVYGLVLVVIAALILYKILNKIFDRLITKSKNGLERKRKQTVIVLGKNLIKYAVIFIMALAALDLYGINVTSLLASLGVLSAVSALALQDTLKDVINGAKIITDNYFMVGDFVKYGDFQGQIIELGLRTTKIMDYDGRVLAISNREISSVINLSQKQASQLIKIPTSYEASTEKVDKILNEVLEELKTWETVDVEKTSYNGIIEFADSAVYYGIRYYCSPGKVYKYKCNLLRLIKEKYDKNNIKIPYMQIEVHNAKH